MPFDSTTRNKLAKFVSEARSLLVGEFGEQLQEVYGIRLDGTVLPLEKLAHLTDTERAKASLLREQIEHILSGMAGTAPSKSTEAVDRIIREQAFTVFNRFCALRMAEERDLVQECVGGGFQSKGFRVFETVAGTGIGNTYDRYKTFLFSLFDEISLDLGVLFDRFSHMGLLFPGENSLKVLMGLLQDSELTALWSEDETIGWIYQYWNSKEERKAMRDASPAPRNSRELAVRNQFFTPRYVVEFLTDNTVGRIWYEMRKGDTVLKENCRYLVRRPNEVFLAAGEKGPVVQENEADLSQEELLKKPVHIEHRPKKDPRDLRVLDPACGSGHFLLYAFDLLEHIYTEAWEDPESQKCEATGQTLREEFEKIEELRQALPKLIIEQNLHGIDIDPRAVQISALALWLRAQKSWKNLGVIGAERPRVAKSNIVTAEPMPGEEDTRREFTAGLKPRVLGQLVDVVFDKMKLAGEAGSLLKIEEEIQGAVTEAKRQWLEGPKLDQQFLFSGMTGSQQKQRELRFDVKGITDERFWEQGEDRILDALRDYAEQAENSRAVHRRLFAEDAARGFAFIELCRKRYDVVLMNPPFGSLPKTQKLDACLPAASAGNLYGAFFIRAAEMVCAGGCVGCITDRTFLLLPTYQEYRDLLRRIGLRCLVDLGWGVLDGAQVATAAYVVHTNFMPDAWFMDSRNSGDKESAVCEACMIGHGAVIIPNYLFETIPTHPIAHWAPPLLRNAFKRHRCFEPAFGTVRKGLSPGDSDRFVNMWWEIPQAEYGLGRRWAPYANGGAFSPFYRATKEVVEWSSDGKIIRAYTFPDGRPRYVIRSAELYGLAGLTFGKRGEVLNVQILPAGQVISNEGYLIFPQGNQREIWIFLAFFNSLITRYLVNLVCGLHKEVGAIKVTPIPADLLANEGTEAESLSRIIYNACRELGNEETNPEFMSIPFGNSSTLKHLFHIHSVRLNALRAEVVAYEEAVNHHIAARFKIEKSELENIRREDSALTKSVELGRAAEIDDLVGSIVSWLLGAALARWDARIALDPSLAPKLPDPFDPLPVCPPGMLVGPEGLPAEANRIISEEWLRARPDANTLPPNGSVTNPTIPDSAYPLRISWDGILVDDPGFNGSQSHRDDIVRRVREVLDLLWKDKAHNIEQEACDILGVSALRDYFRRPAGFFQDHLKRYSKSRRKAPIYWPLSTESGTYTLWVYYHRLDDQILFKCIRIVEVKIKEIADDIERLKKEMGDSANRKQRGDLEKLQDLYQELVDFRAELQRVAKFYKPDLNDGVIINAAPLWKLFRLKKWQQSCKDCWDKLEAGEYDWSHMAMNIRPDQVRGKCKIDKSIAIAHGLEELYVEPEEANKKGRRKRKKG
jgi:hypothetical protein